MSRPDSSRDDDERPLAFVVVKAFGDLTITASTLRRLGAADRQRCSLLIAPHLADLTRVLDPGCAVELLPVGNILPAVFDIKKHRAGAIWSSALALKRALSTAAPSSTLVFDRLSWRERFIAGRRSARAFGPGLAPNVYLAQEQLLQRAFPGIALSPAPAVLARPTASRRIGLFPFSRVAAKNIPVPLVESLLNKCRACGFEPVIMLLDGEMFPDLPGTPVERLARNFEALAQGIRTVTAVISADSLPAHLAEYNGRAAFVASPVENAYYMPPTTFSGRHWGLFTQPDELAKRLVDFLQHLS